MVVQAAGDAQAALAVEATGDAAEDWGAADRTAVGLEVPWAVAVAERSVVPAVAGMAGTGRSIRGMLWRCCT